ncbi:pyruvate formate-lyase-activating protein [Paenibacillus sp. J5C_2022]|uniref:pyruvate formate-lyase-activating protein n=1 Tax=Paenibacillus sp. J5C2022 TaxID=2977129 RepID=UPI0021CF5B3C|nr:pyruvate formate-lyase-activating protein [Paenibacillus sp. J5C2022]MCU6709798.1 pyruvate formate-lyase-activating protein [Paenibacillus sp. J5C2022]
MSDVRGRIHSFETFGTVDGPGIRFVLFMQGCALRCRFCHNPDTWDKGDGQEMSVDEVLAEIEPYLRYYRASGGGLTVTGGEPTLQAAFVAELFREAKRRYGLHTALDSSGYCEPSVADETGLLEATDLVLLDLKQINEQKHIGLTTQSNERILRFATHLSDIGTTTWIRHVVIPGVTDDYSDLQELGRYIGKLKCVQKIELLPYHRMGVYKWQQLGLPYMLDGVPAPSERDMERARAIVELAQQLAKQET